MLITSIFSFSHDVFYPMKDRNYDFSKIYFVVCKCFQFGRVSHFCRLVKRETREFFSSRYGSKICSLYGKFYMKIKRVRQTLFPVKSNLAEFKLLIIKQKYYRWLKGVGWGKLREVNERATESAQQDQTARMCRLTLLCTLCKVNPSLRTTGGGGGVLRL